MMLRGGGEHLLHAGAAARAFVADDDDVAGFHLAFEDSLGGVFFAFEDDGGAAELRACSDAPRRSSARSRWGRDCRTARPGRRVSL